jgi:hypothetical protein
MQNNHTDFSDANGEENPKDRDMEIGALVERIRALQSHIDALGRDIQQAKQELRPLLRQRGDTWSDDVGYARVMSESLQRFYDAEALDRLILSDPLRYGWLKDYRREKIVAERIQVK